MAVENSPAAKARKISTTDSPHTEAAKNETSFPKSKIRVLLLENCHQVAVDAFRAQGFQVETAVALSEKELNDRLQGTNGQEPIHILGVRSKTAVTADMCRSAKRLLCVGAFCIGTDNHDLGVAEQCGIPFFNSPFANTRSVAELVLCEIIALARQIMDRSAECHRGAWNKVSNGCYEARGKTLGIVGYGHVGAQISVLAEALGMRVVFYDVNPKLPLGNATSCKTLDECLSKSMFVTLHVPQLESTKNLIGAEQISKMPKGSYLINASRGDVVVIDAFAAALKSGHLAGGAADVFPSEPKKNGEGLFKSPLSGCKNVIMTPHVGGSTEEAQEAIGHEVSGALIRYVNTGITYGAVNFPELSAVQKPGTHRLLNCHKNVPGVLMKINTELSKGGCNITTQQLGTSENIGYLIVDVDKHASPDAVKALKSLDESVRTRVLW